ncbi:hypothetical protein Bpfe_030053 [Biomphalaria pfeifferi]|uniref:Uncharacterized protein n=1 Tax=Biomphalaria pfeifferi TaxID=112525 RepID=A0AAD8AQH9_BIOPF|nr:hypothetical protein Bpfe_030053 [Biomphalaria pfeifferi]
MDATTTPAVNSHILNVTPPRLHQLKAFKPNDHNKLIPTQQHQLFQDNHNHPYPFTDHVNVHPDKAALQTQ